MGLYIHVYAYVFNLAHREFQNWANQSDNIRKKKSKPLQVQTTDSIKTALLHPFSILRVVRLQRYGSEKQTWTVFFFLPYHTTWEFQQQQTKFTHCINSCTVNQICTFIVLAMHFECKYCWDLYKSWQILITRAQKTFLSAR